MGVGSDGGVGGVGVCGVGVVGSMFGRSGRTVRVDVVQARFHRVFTRCPENSFLHRFWKAKHPDPKHKSTKNHEKIEQVGKKDNFGWSGAGEFGSGNSTPTNTARTELHSMITLHHAKHAWLKSCKAQDCTSLCP